MLFLYWNGLVMKEHSSSFLLSIGTNLKFSEVNRIISISKRISKSNFFFSKLDLFMVFLSSCYYNGIRNLVASTVLIFWNSCTHLGAQNLRLLSLSITYRSLSVWGSNLKSYSRISKLILLIDLCFLCAKSVKFPKKSNKNGNSIALCKDACRNPMQK